MSKDSIKKILEEIIAAQDEVTANKIVANLQKTFMVKGSHEGNHHPNVGEYACVGETCNGVTNCDEVHTECSPQACDILGAKDHDCKPVSCRQVTCDTMGNYSE